MLLWLKRDEISKDCVSNHQDEVDGQHRAVVQHCDYVYATCQLTLNYGFRNNTYDKKKLNAGTYRRVREKLPLLPSSLVQCARDQAAELLKSGRCRTLPTKKLLQIRYDKRTFKFYPECKYVSLSTVAGRLNFSVNVYIVTCSDNSFVSSRHLRAVKGRYQYLKAKLQSLGTASARRKLKRLSGAERRFTLDVNHVIAKKLVQKPYDVFAVETLRVHSRKSRGRRLNKMLGVWSYGELLALLTYKAESSGKRVVQVNPSYTSQRCSKCGYIDRNNRKGLQFKCKQCGFELNADLNAARNIGELGRSELVRLSVNQPIVAHNITAATSHSLSRLGG